MDKPLTWAERELLEYLAKRGYCGQACADALRRPYQEVYRAIRRLGFRIAKHPKDLDGRRVR